ncbi:MAG: hypothetical protein ACMUEM_05135 [Flavobacteriales bacterium AspAUS03]
MIRILQNKKVFIPNSKINEETINNNDIGIGYASDINRPVRIVQ